MSPAASSTGDQPHSPHGASTASTEGSVGRPTPPPSASPSDDDGEGEGGYGDFRDNRHDGHSLPNMFIESLSFPDPIAIPGLELSHMNCDTSPGPCRRPASSPSPTTPAENDEPTAATSTRTSSHPHISTPPSEGSNQQQDPDLPNASQPTDVYTVVPKDGTDEAKSSSAFLRTLSLVPLSNIKYIAEMERSLLFWRVVMTKDQALELLADTNIGAVMGDEDNAYDPTDC